MTPAPRRPSSPAARAPTALTTPRCITFGGPGTTHTYVVDAGMTQSGVLHVGTHHDGSLRDYVWGERVAVLVGDPNVAGVYDTVWVDLDNDYDFRDEKPVTKADPTNPATYNNPISYRDMNADGKADLNGGLLYFIGDGVNYIPGSDWLWGGIIPPPGNGDLIAMHGPWVSGYSHGTNCASNVVAQGAIDGALPSFRDLPPGPGQPAAAVYGMAPGAKLLAMNDAYTFTGRSNTLDGYMFLAFGYDAIDQTGFNWFYGPGYVDGDTVAASSHSYGYSGDFNDGWDYEGQFIADRPEGLCALPPVPLFHRQRRPRLWHGGPAQPGDWASALAPRPSSAPPAGTPSPTRSRSTLTTSPPFPTAALAPATALAWT